MPKAWPNRGMATTEDASRRRTGPGRFRRATLLGLVEGAVATAALGLLPESLEQAATTLPQAVGDASLIIQPDHTLIAPITLDAGTWELVDAVSHLESWGPVTMHRLDPARLRSAVSGQDPQDLLDRLGQASRTPLPQSVEYAVRDAPVPPGPGGARHCGRGRSAGCPDAQQSGIRQSRDQPVHHGPAAGRGAAQARRGRNRHGLTGTGRTCRTVGLPLASPMPDGQSVTRLVAHLLGNRHEPTSPRHRWPMLTPGQWWMCRRAIADDQRLWLRYTDGSDMRTEFVWNPSNCGPGA